MDGLYGVGEGFSSEVALALLLFLLRLFYLDFCVGGFRFHVEIAFLRAKRRGDGERKRAMEEEEEEEEECGGFSYNSSERTSRPGRPVVS